MKLGFPEAVQNCFSYLLADYHFKLVKVEETYARYESEKAFVNVYHGRASREIGLEFGLLVSPFKYKKHFIGELILIADPQTYEGFRYFATQTPEGVTKGVSDLAVLLKTYGHRALNGEKDFFELLGAQSERLVRDSIADSEARRIRPQAEEAFRSGDYGKAAELYGSIEPSLTPTEAKKLAFARSKLE